MKKIHAFATDNVDQKEKYKMSTPQRTASLSSLSKQPHAAEQNSAGESPQEDTGYGDGEHGNQGDTKLEDGASMHDDQHQLQEPDHGFRPFFTLIEDANTSEYHHPTVHYIFSDDDTDLVTEGALRSLKSTHGISPVPPNESSGPQHPPKPTSLPPPLPGAQEHYVIVDVQPTEPEKITLNASNTPNTTSTSAAAEQGHNQSSTPPVDTQTQSQSPQPYIITSAHSLSPSWQVLDTHLDPAPTFNSSGHSPTTPNDSSPVGGVMLKIEGTSGYDPQIGSGAKKEQGQSLENMLEQFEKRMGELRRVIEAGGGNPKDQNEGAAQQQ